LVDFGADERGVPVAGSFTAQRMDMSIARLRKLLRTIRFFDKENPVMQVQQEDFAGPFVSAWRFHRCSQRGFARP